MEYRLQSMHVQSYGRAGRVSCISLLFHTPCITYLNNSLEKTLNYWTKTRRHFVSCAQNTRLVKLQTNNFELENFSKWHEIYGEPRLQKINLIFIVIEKNKSTGVRMGKSQFDKSKKMSRILQKLINNFFCVRGGGDW